MLQSKLQEVSAKKDALKARAASAKSTKEVNEMLYAEVNAILGSLTDSSSAYAAFQRMEEKVIAMEAESEAVGLIGASGKTDGLEAKFAALELTDADAELVRHAFAWIPTGGHDA